MNKVYLIILVSISVLVFTTPVRADKDYLDPILKSLREKIKKEFAESDTKPTFEVPGSDGVRTMIVKYKTKQYIVPMLLKDGNKSLRKSIIEGPMEDGFLIKAYVQYLGAANQAKTPQTLQEKHWTTFLNVYPVKKEYKQIYLALSYTEKTEPELIKKLKQMVENVCVERNELAEKNAVSGKLTPEEVCDRIRKGELGKELAERAINTPNLWMHEIKQDVVENQIFSYGDYREGVNLIVDKGKLVFLCSGWGTGPISDLKVIKRGDKSILQYTYSIGSGIQRPCPGEYELGSGKRSLPQLKIDLKPQKPDVIIDK